MTDIQLRFGKDMLVLSGPLDDTLARQGINTAADMPFLMLMEPETIADALQLQITAGAQCLVTPTHGITPARLAYLNMRADGALIAQSALDTAHQINPQHILVDIGPCGLPLDSSSKSSLNEHKDQYKNAANFFTGLEFDAFFLDGFTSLDDLRCALMGVRQVSDRPVFASVLIRQSNTEADAPLMEDHGDTPAKTASKDFDVTSINSGLPTAGYSVLDDYDPFPPDTQQQPLDPACWPEALDIMMEYEASVVGFETSDPLHLAYDYAALAAERTSLPLLASLRAVEDPLKAKQRGLTPLEDLKEYTPDTLYDAGEHLRHAGVQFLRATGNALAASTGALVAATKGLDAIKRD